MTRERLGWLLVVGSVGCAGAVPTQPTRCPSIPAAPAPTACPPATTEAPAARTSPEAEGTADVRAGTCDTSWLPAGLVAPATPESAVALIEQVSGWLAIPPDDSLGRDPLGLLWVEAEDDEFEDDPGLVGNHGRLLCSPDADWLAAATRQRARGRSVDCQGGVCCWQGDAEGDPTTLLTFRRDDRADPSAGAAPAWLLRAVLTVGEANIEPPELAAARRWVANRIVRLQRTRCPAPPP